MDLDSCWEVEWFKEFLKFNTSHPDPNYGPTIDWLRGKADKMKMKFSVVELAARNPIAILTLEGADASLPSVAFNCHMDVVPVEPHGWTDLPMDQTPFDAWEDPITSNIYARGSQDMKIVGAALLCAICRLQLVLSKKDQPIQTLFERTVHILFTPDEELGGARGVALFVKNPALKELNIGVYIDEGIAHESMAEKSAYVFYAERHPCWGLIEVHDAYMGHGSNFNAEPSAVDRILSFSKVLQEIHTKEYEDMKNSADAHQLSPHEYDVGTYCSVNITVLKSGVSADGGASYQYNQIPGDALLAFDMRIPYDKYETILDHLEREAERLEVDIRWIQKAPAVAPSPTDGEEGIWFRRLCQAINKCGVTTIPRIFPAATDARYFRKLGIPAYGFSPLCCTPKLLHAHNEFVNRGVYLAGISIYEEILKQLLVVCEDPRT